MSRVEVLTSTPAELPAVTRNRMRDLFTREEIAELTARSDWRGLWALASTWAIIALAFALPALWPNVFTMLIALVLLGGRQLALAVLQHEGAHGTLFRTRWMNNILPDWFAARLVWQHLPKYRAHHLIHHTKTGTDQDPDISLHAGYPTTRASMRRKMLRDISGLTGLKVTLGMVLMDAGLLKWTVAANVEKLPQEGRRWWDYPLSFLHNAGGMLITNAVLFAILAASGHGWLYGLWVAAYLTTFPLFVRIRSIAEHGMLPRDQDMFLNTRTTHAGWFARLTFAPMSVNYHQEHHLMAAVPYYRLARAHALMRERRGAADLPGYRDVLRLAASSA